MKILISFWLKLFQMIWSWHWPPDAVYLTYAEIRCTSDGGFYFSGVVDWDTRDLWRPGDRIETSRVVAIYGGFSEPYPLALSTASSHCVYRIGHLEFVVCNPWETAHEHD